MSRTPHEKNERIFRFFRGLRDRIVQHYEKEAIDGFVLWASSLDALAQIHARRLSIGSGNRRRFVQALIDLAPGHRLESISVPLLHHDLTGSADPTTAAVLGLQSLREYSTAAAMSRVWTTEEDGVATGAVAQLTGTVSAPVGRLIRENRYANLLYEDYRCSPVHGLDLGWRTYPGAWRDADDGHPSYSNYMYIPADDRPVERRYRTRICFALSFLTKILTDAIDELERQCDGAGWVIPPYATIED